MHSRPAVARDLGQQPERGEADQERVRGGRDLEPERGLERLALRRGQPGGCVQHRPTEQLQPGVGQLHLRLGRDHPPDLDVRRRALGRVVEQRRLADPGLTRHDQGPAPPGPCLSHQRVELRQLLVPAEQDHVT